MCVQDDKDVGERNRIRRMRGEKKKIMFDGNGSRAINSVFVDTCTFAFDRNNTISVRISILLLYTYTCTCA